MTGERFGWSYPPGAGGVETFDVEVSCWNPECPGVMSVGDRNVDVETGQVYEPFVFTAKGETHLGATSITPEECPECHSATHLEARNQ